MFLKGIKYYCFITAVLLLNSICNAQLGGLGGPLFNITFGNAATGNLTIAGPSLPLGVTAFPYSSDVCPPPGSYTVVSGVTTDCFDSSWIPLLGDNSPGSLSNGYMMLINDKAYSSPKTIFAHNVGGCQDVNYQFSVAVINIDKPYSGCTRFTSLTLQVEDIYGNVIASTTTGDIEFAVFNQGYHFTKYGVNFNIPASTSGVTVKIIDETSALSNCNNGIAIDDIKVTVTGPKVNIGFDNTPIGEWVKSACFQNNTAFTMHGTVDTGFFNPLVQWEQSTDDGLTWSDIPGATGYTHTQNFPVADTFLFRLRAADSSLISHPDCGVASEILRVQVDGLPRNYNITNNSPVCAGQQLIFNAAGADKYIWTGPNGFYDNISYPHIFHSSLKNSGTYYVQVFSLGGCYVKDSTHAVVIGTDVHAGPDTSICKGNSVGLHTSTGTKYLWSPAKGLSGTTVINPTAKPGETTDYTVMVTDQYGCSDTAHVKITVLNKNEVKADITAPAYLCRSFDSVYFASTSFGDIKKWFWDFGNGQTSFSANPPVQNYQVPANRNSYLVKLSVTDTVGCTDATSLVLNVVDNCHIAVPSAFTPNNDGLNDFLYPLNAYKATNLLFRVYNRFGQTVFKTDNWNIKWDGKIGGLQQPTGVYVWTLDYIDAMRKKISLKGTTVLIR
jgi:gliding motility-associated-like protein